MNLIQFAYFEMNKVKLEKILGRDIYCVSLTVLCRSSADESDSTTVPLIVGVPSKEVLDSLAPSYTPLLPLITKWVEKQHPGLIFTPDGHSTESSPITIDEYDVKCVAIDITYDV